MNGPGGETSALPRRQGVPGPVRAAAWWVAACLACLAILPVNGAPLFYFDTGGYLAQGRTALVTLGLLPAVPPPAPDAAAPGPAPAADGTVSANRSATYALFLALLAAGPGLALAPVLQSLALLLALHLPARVIARVHAPRLPARLGGAPLSAPALTALAAFAACLGSAPFYTASLMPDIFAPVLLLSAATLAVHAGAMRTWEILLALALGLAAATAHPSHLLIAALLVPAAILVALLLRPARAWAGVLLVAAIASGATAERLAFGVAVRTVARAEVTYAPFLTVRLIVDGPGMDRLAEICPWPSVATCALYDLLRDQPQRITPTNIMFEKDPALGSFALLPPEIRKEIAFQQHGFVIDVVTTHPAGVTKAVLLNTFRQLLRVSVVQTLPLGDMLARVRAIAGGAPEVLARARLTREPAWLGPLDRLHAGLYLASALGLALLLLRPRGGPPPALRAFALVLLLGILANALVCGAVSQPADRYGARVAFLLPALLALLAPFPFRKVPAP